MSEGTLLAQIVSNDEAIQLNGLKLLKNSIIGHPDQKHLFLTVGAVPRLVSILTSNKNERVRVEAGVIIGSLAYGGEALSRELLSLPTLLPALYASLEAGTPQLLVTSALRTLVLLLSSSSDPRELLFTEHNLSNICNLLKHGTHKQVCLVAKLLAVCTKTASQKKLLIDCQVFDALVNSIPNSHALDALIPLLTPATPATPIPITTLLRLVRSEDIPTKLSSARLLSEIFKTGELPVGQVLSIIPILVRIISSTGLAAPIRGRAALILSSLTTTSESLQKCAIESRAINHLSFLLSTTDQKHAALKALATLALFKDDYRKNVIEAGAIPHIVSAMSDEDPLVRAASAEAIRALSRSVGILRTSLVDANVATPLFKLLSDEDLEVKIAASAALCNLVLEFSPMRKSILEAGVLKILCANALSDVKLLRLNSMWAIKHLVYSAEGDDVKESVLNELGYGVLVQLCDDDEIAVQEQALDVIRNVMTTTPTSLDLLISHIGMDHLFSIIERKLSSEYTEILVSAVFSTVHIATGSDAHRSELMRRKRILEGVRDLMTNPSHEVRCACVWVVINLTWTDEGGDADARKARAEILRDMGYIERLLTLKDDVALDVRERTKTALFQLQSNLS